LYGHLIETRADLLLMNSEGFPFREINTNFRVPRKNFFLGKWHP
jgi:hypothetical protein